MKTIQFAQMIEEEEISPKDADTLRILIVTDTHLGVHENDPVRANDSFRAFEEALEIGKKHNCDFVLHGGDLFEHNKPSKNTIVKAVEILKKHTLSNNPISFQVVSDQEKNFVSGKVNFEDENINVGFPVFMIHGNHDDPSGVGQQSALNILSSMGLINYFGRADDINRINVFPVLLAKGETRLALYGLGNIRDERLHRAFKHQKVTWVRPTGDKRKWFNMFVIHQNRTRRSKVDKNYIPEEILPKFLDVVYWAHEHECLIELEESLGANFYVTQPGSPIATSLGAADARPKYVGIMDIRGDQCRLHPVRLKKTRPFVWDEIVLDDNFERDVEQDDIEKFLIDRVNILIQRGLKSHAEGPIRRNLKEGEALTKEELDRIPLIRLRVDHTHFERINANRFGQLFVNKVANPEQIILCHKKSKRAIKVNKIPGMDIEETPEGPQRPIKEIIYDMLRVNRTPLRVLSELRMTEAVEEFVEKETPMAIETFVKRALKETQEQLFGDDSLKIKEDVEKFLAESAESKFIEFEKQVVERREAEDEHAEQVRQQKEAQKVRQAEEAPRAKQEPEESEPQQAPPRRQRKRKVEESPPPAEPANASEEESKPGFQQNRKKRRRKKVRQW